LFLEGWMGVPTTVLKVIEAPRVEIAVTVLKKESKKSARRSPGCFGGGAGWHGAGVEGLEGEERCGVAILRSEERVMECWGEGSNSLWWGDIGLMLDVVADEVVRMFVVDGVGGATDERCMGCAHGG
jgi:hypothetical protein